MTLEHGVDKVKFLLAMGQKLLTTDTSGQATFSNLAKDYGISKSMLPWVITAKMTTGDEIPMKKREVDE